MAYYLYDGAKSIGPFEVADLVKRPDFNGAALVFPVGATGADAWKPASAVPELASALAPAGVQPPPPPPPPKPPVARTEITLSFPAPRPVQPEPAPAKIEPAPAAAAAPVDEFAALKPAAPSEKLVLVVDDDDGVRSLIEMSAMGQGFRVVTAVNGLEAAEKLAARAPDLIVTDLMMPGQSGYEFLRSLQAAGSGRIPVFVVTGSSLDASTVAVIKQEANVVEFIGKPIAMSKFVAALHKHLKTKKA